MDIRKKKLSLARELSAKITAQTIAAGITYEELEEETIKARCRVKRACNSKSQKKNRD